MITSAGIATALLLPTRLEAQIAPYTAYSAQEMSMLPEYCKYTLEFRIKVEGGNDPARIQHWKKLFENVSSGNSGATNIFDAIHHYCWGLSKVNYSKFWARSAQERLFYLGDSITEFDYVIKYASPGDKMLPEIHTKKGESLIAIGKFPLALVELERAIELKPDYWPPYAVMSDYYQDAGNIKMARQVLERGLSSSPDAKALTRRLADLEMTKGKPNIAAHPPKKPITPK
jgi:tetratricopeptide (TPR) repeat protein